VDRRCANRAVRQVKSVVHPLLFLPISLSTLQPLQPQAGGIVRIAHKISKAYNAGNCPLARHFVVGVKETFT
jgi:hypothetical protein